MTFLSSTILREGVRRPPYPDTIPTWDVNEAYLKANARAEAAITRRGYLIKFGIEINLGILSETEAARLLQKKSPTYFWRQGPRDRLHQDLENTKSVDPGSAYAQTYALLEGLAAQHRQSQTADSLEWLQNWRMARGFYRTAVGQGEERRRTQAGKNFLISSLHLMPPEMGGLRGLIENRHRPTHYGDGWWDGKNSIELRTPPLVGHAAAIGSYHYILGELDRTIRRFGFIPETHQAIAQSHFSVWRDRGRINIMAGRDEASLEEQKEIAEHLADLLLAYPAQYPDAHRDMNKVVAGAPFVGSSRVSTIRICDTHWELRLPHYSGMTHLARDLFLINAAVRYHVADEASIDAAVDKIHLTRIKAMSKEMARRVRHLPENERQAAIEAMPQTEEVKYLVPIVDPEKSADPFLTNAKPIRCVKKMQIESEYLRAACPFISCLQASFLKEDGSIEVPIDVILYNAPLMLTRLGPKAADLFTVYHPFPAEEARVEDISAGFEDAQVYNLNVVYGWQELFRQLKITADNRIDASMLHPHLAQQFEGLRVVSYRNELHGGEWTDAQVNSRDLNNMITAGHVAAGKVPFGIWTATKAQKEIYGGIRQACTEFDPAEATSFLVDAYEETRTAKKGERRTSPAVRLINHIVDSTLGKSLRLHLVGSLLPLCGQGILQDYEILRFQLSAHEHLLAAIPEATRYDPRSEAAFSGLAQALKNPAQMYGASAMQETYLPKIMGRHLRARETPLEDIRKTIGERGQALSALSLRIVAGMQPEMLDQLAVAKDYLRMAKTIDWVWGWSSVRDETKITQKLLRQDLNKAIYAGLKQEVTSWINHPQCLKDTGPLGEMRRKAYSGMKYGTRPSL